MADTSKIRKPEMGKWGCWRFFAAVPAIRKYLPATTPLTERSLQKYLAAYGSVYVKPSSGWGGRGITKVWKRMEGGKSMYRRIKVIAHGWRKSRRVRIRTRRKK